MNEKLPEGWREVAISDILTKEQLKEVEDFVRKKIKEGKRIIDCTTELKAITGKWREELLKKGVDSDFLAYALANGYQKGVIK